MGIWRLTDATRIFGERGGLLHCTAPAVSQPLRQPASALTTTWASLVPERPWKTRPPMDILFGSASAAGLRPHSPKEGPRNHSTGHTESHITRQVRRHRTLSAGGSWHTHPDPAHLVKPLALQFAVVHKPDIAAQFHVPPLPAEMECVRRGWQLDTHHIQPFRFHRCSALSTQNKTSDVQERPVTSNHTHTHTHNENRKQEQSKKSRERNSSGAAGQP